MSPRWFSVDVDALHPVCVRLEWFGLVLIAAAVMGLLFGMFWLAFTVVILAAGVGTGVNAALIAGGGGLFPIAIASVVLWFGISRRLLASRLRDLRTLAHARGIVSLEQTAGLMSGNLSSAERLLLRACELGIAAPLTPQSPR